MVESVFEANDLCKDFGEKTVLDRLHLSLGRGCVVGLLGKNGAGKTTLLKCAVGLLRASAGSVRIFGEDAWDLSAQAKSRIGYVPQEPALYPWLTVQQMIDYTASFYPSWNDALIKRFLEEQELDGGAKVGPLSVGQLQKLAIALAIGHEPELLLLDEPVASLDPAARRDFLRTLLEMVGEGDRTILFSTHITSDVERVANEVAVLQGGRVLMHEELDGVRDRFKRLRVTSENGTPPGDFGLPGVLRTERDGGTAVLTLERYEESMPAALRERFDVDVEVLDMNLEEIYLELHGKGGR